MGATRALLELGSGSVELRDKRIQLSFARAAIGFERVDNGTIKPERAVATTSETGPKVVSEEPVIGEDRSHVVELFRRDNKPHRLWRAVEMGDVAFLPRPPGRLGQRIGVRAASNDFRDLIAEPCANRRQHGRAALILHGIVQEGGNGLIFGGAIFQQNCGDRE